MRTRIKITIVNVRSDMTYESDSHGRSIQDLIVLYNTLSNLQRVLYRCGIHYQIKDLQDTATL
jgi:hypothetical protein